MEYEVELGDGTPLKVAAARAPSDGALAPGAAVSLAVRDVAGCVVFAAQ
jgi:hypothetical protein